VERVTVTGNHYFNAQTLKELLSVHAADSLDHHGAYSQAMVSADVSALQAVYRNNGFSNIKVTPETSTPETSATDNSAPETSTVTKAPVASQPRRRTTSLEVIYRIEEGQQVRVGSARIDGNDHVDTSKLT